MKTFMCHQKKNTAKIFGILAVLAGPAWAEVNGIPEGSVANDSNSINVGVTTSTSTDTDTRFNRGTMRNQGARTVPGRRRDGSTIQIPSDMDAPTPGGDLSGSMTGPSNPSSLNTGGTGSTGATSGGAGAGAGTEGSSGTTGTTGTTGSGGTQTR